MSKYISPKEYETLFHIVSNEAIKADGERYVFLTNLASKLAGRGTTALNLNFNNESDKIESMKNYTKNADNERRLQLGLRAVAKARREVEAE